MKKDKKESKPKSPDSYFRPAQEIRKTLRISEHDYCMISPVSFGHPRDLYIYGVLDELEKAGMAVIRYEELLEDEGKDVDVDDRIKRNLFVAIRDEQNLYIRKLTEMLAELSNFQETNTQDYFGHYFIVKALDDERKKIASMQKYYGCEDVNAVEFKDALIRDIQRAESKGTIDLAKCWYLASRRPGEFSKRKIASFDRILETAIGQSKNTAEKIALGISYYTAYSIPSQGVHLNIGNSGHDVSKKDLETGIAHMGLISSHILVKCRKLLGHRRKGWVSFIKKVLETNRKENGNFRKQLNPKIDVGDFVLIGNEIAQVKKTKISRFGYKSFFIKYIAPSCNLVHKENWALAVHVRLYVQRKKIAKDVHKLLSEDGGPEPSKIKINKSILGTVIHMWEDMGQKEYYHGRPDLAKQKIEATINARKNKK